MDLPGISERDCAIVVPLLEGACRTAIVLGSGFSTVAEDAITVARVSYSRFSSVPEVAAVPGHAGELSVARVPEGTVLFFSGRIHQYQGVSAYEAAWPARFAASLGVQTLIVTNASGAVSERVCPDGLALIADHINLTGGNPLIGWTGAQGKGPFVPMHDAYSHRLRELARSAAARQGISLAEGVYAAVSGPTYETSAEVRALRALGADMVGMSTVPEVLVARALGMDVLGISLVSNNAASESLSHDAVLAAGDRAHADLSRLLLAILQTL